MSAGEELVREGTGIFREKEGEVGCREGIFFVVFVLSALFASNAFSRNGFTKRR
jgi:hypothetical protein